METSNPFRRSRPPIEPVQRALETDAYAAEIFSASPSNAAQVEKELAWIAGSVGDEATATAKVQESPATAMTGAIAGDVSDQVFATEIAAPENDPTSPKSPEIRRNKPPPPAVAPRKRASRIEPRSIAPTENANERAQTPPPQSAPEPEPKPEPELEPVSDPVDPFGTEDDLADDAVIGEYVTSAEPEPVETAEIETETYTPQPLNPFYRQSKSAGGIRNSLDNSELSSAGYFAESPYGSGNGRVRQSLDLDRFSEIMRLGPGALQQTFIPEVDSSYSSNISTGNRRSFSDPIYTLETANPAAVWGSSVVHGVVGVEERTATEKTNPITPTITEPASPASLSRASSIRVRPPPPKPRTRSGGKSTLSTPTTPTTPSLATSNSNRPTSGILRYDSDSQQSSQQSLQSPSTPSTSLPPPSPQSLTAVHPIDGSKEQDKKKSSITPTNHGVPPPPPPPPARSYSVLLSSHRSSIPATKPSVTPLPHERPERSAGCARSARTERPERPADSKKPEISYENYEKAADDNTTGFKSGKFESLGTTKGAKTSPPPPPPPVRRSSTNSTNQRHSRQMMSAGKDEEKIPRTLVGIEIGVPGTPGVQRSLSLSLSSPTRTRPHQLPPPPPPPRKRLNEVKEETSAPDILNNLERLQKEVDELRGNIPGFRLGFVTAEKPV
ncbi:hypothetical protein BZA77DRAFT_350444 [Pyronema omphalodes]|nr:hypothetical protein BZA77DRAFT_350444 [Pyronema omphalodes]